MPTITLTSRSGLILFAAVASLICLGYSLYTRSVWEDALITLRHGENLLQGNGLTYNPGERVHGFTSPINVLLLTLCHALAGQSSYVATCWLYRLFTIAAFAGGGVFALRALGNVSPRWSPALWFFAIAYLFDAKSVAFSTNGMETGFMLLFLGWALYLMSQGGPELWLLRGLSWAGLMWTRPDGCVYIAALSLAELIFLAARGRRAVFRSLARSAGLCALLYSPWFLWAWWYYGSPVPHTVIAKANVELGPLQQALLVLDDLISRVVAQAGLTFRPLYDRDYVGWVRVLGWSRLINGITKVAGIFCLIYWLMPVSDRFGRAISFCFTLICIHFSYMQYCFPWYYPPATLIGIVVLARGFTTLAESAAGGLAATRLWSRKGLALGGMGILLAGQVVLFPLVAREEQIKQEVIEDGNRAAIGSWLKMNALPTDSVYLEPLGYIGYFSGLRMLDHPGLVSPEVVAARRNNPGNLALILGELKPDWVVLRFREYDWLKQNPLVDGFNRNYHPVRQFSVSKRLDEYDLLPGEYVLRYDADFIVFARNKSPTEPPALPPTTSPDTAPAALPPPQ